MIRFPEWLLQEVRREVQHVFARDGIVDVSAVAERVRSHYEDCNLALEDFESQVLRIATEFGAPMLLDCLEATVADGKADRVELLADGPAWIVRLTENGVVNERQFEVESHARAFASGQSFRIGAAMPIAINGHAGPLAE